MAEPESDADRLVTPAFVALTLSGLAYFTAIGLLIPVLPLFATRELAVGAVAVGIAVGALQITALVLRPAAGRAADRWGRRALMVLGAILLALGLLAHIAVSDYWLLLLLRVLLGVADAMFLVASMAALGDLAPESRRGEALSYSSLGLYLGIAFGPVLGEYLLSVGGFDLVWVGASVLALLSALLASQLPALPGPQASERGSGLVFKGVVGPSLAFLAGLVGAAGFLGFAALYARDIGMDGAGGVLFAYGVTVVVVRLALAKLTDAVPAYSLSAGSLIVCGLGLLAIGLVSKPVGMYLGAILLAVGISFLTPAFYRVLMARVARSKRGAAAATFTVLIDFGIGGGPILYGLIARPFGLSAAFAFSAAIALVAGLVGIVAGRPRSPESTAA